ncbi:MAG: flagellar hook-basal body complex protein FliE [Hyphomicrobiaceae bacterium]|nr:flagellar hook-basal body complex protein FliE [Hyphomicrobiaceae bacterium]
MIDQLSPLGAAASTAVGSAWPAVGASRSAAAPAPADFGAVLGRLISDAADGLRAAEATSIAGIKGQAPVQQVVETVLAAEQTLQAAIAIRDKVTAAYLELSRMAI